MDIARVRAFLKWCAVLNGGLLILASLIIRWAGDSVFQIHSQWIPMTRDAFNAQVYGLLGMFKIIVITFNLIPYLAIRILERKRRF